MLARIVIAVIGLSIGITMIYNSAYRRGKASGELEILKMRGGFYAAAQYDAYRTLYFSEGAEMSETLKANLRQRGAHAHAEFARHYLASDLHRFKYRGLVSKIDKEPFN